MNSYDFQGGSFRDSGYYSDHPFAASQFGRTPPVVRWLILINALVFLVQLIVREFTSFDFTRYFGLSSDLAIGRFWVWQFFTSMFLHSTSGVFHILFNMFALWIFGREVERRFGSRRFLLFYPLAGIFAGLCFVIVGILGASFELAVGASGAIMGVMVVFACLYPDATLLAFLLVPVKAKHLILFLIAIDLIYFVFMADSSQVAHSAHLGGALFGFLYFRYEPRLRAYLQSLEEREARRARQNEREVREKVDRLLDKIAAGESITPKERKFLGEASKKYYGKRGR